MAFSTSHWLTLDHALKPQSFTGFQLSGFDSQNLASLENSVASVRSQFVEVVENREWEIISRQLAVLQHQAQYVALRVDGSDLDVIVGKQPTRDIQPGESYVGAEKKYLEFLHRLLTDMYPAAQAFKLSAQAEATATQVLNSAGSTFGFNQAVVAAANLVVPFLKFRGKFKGVVVVSASGVSSALAAEWEAAEMWAIPKWSIVRACVQGWLWDTATNKVHDTNSDLWHGNPQLCEIRNLESAVQLEANLRFTS